MRGERFELTDEAEFEINLHTDRPDQEEFTGRVISGDEPPRGIAEAQVAGFALEGPGGMRATSDAQGSFRANRRTVAMLVYARTEDGSLAGIVRIGPDDRSADIPVASAASAHGRLIDATSGAPLGNVEVTYGVSWDGPHTGLECGGKIRSNDRGEFTAHGLVPGWQYQFVAINAKVPASRPTGGYWVQLTKVTPDWAENIDLGDFKVDLSEAPKPVRGAVRERAPRRSKIYDTEADGNEQIAAALKIAKAEKKRVLLQFGADWCGWCHKLSECFKNNEEVAAALRENYVVVLIDVNRVGDSTHNADVNERYGNPTRYGLPVLVVLDADGQLLKTKDTGELEKDGRHDPKKVLAFLNRWKPE
jgi:thiol-disulfide isomerase/thioredoxin